MKIVIILVTLILCSCSSVVNSPEEGIDSDTDTDADSDTDGDTDTDTDTDSDTDTDADSDTDGDTDDGGVDGGSDGDTDTDTGDNSCITGDDCRYPPWDVCAEDSETILIHYTGLGTCVEGLCQYAFEIVGCGYECVVVEGEDDWCKEDVCDGVDCSIPPDAECGLFDPLVTNLLGVWQPGYCADEVTGGAEPGECLYPAIHCWCLGTCIVDPYGDDYCDDGGIDCLEY